MPTPPTIEVTPPTAQYTAGRDDALVQFQWRVAATATTPAGKWHDENYSPPQTQLAARSDPAVLAVAPGYWGDAEVRADVLEWITSQFGFSALAFLGDGA